MMMPLMSERSLVAWHEMLQSLKLPKCSDTAMATASKHLIFKLGFAC